MGRVFGLFLIIVGGFLLFEGFERKDGAAAKSNLAAAGWVNSFEASTHSVQQAAFLVGGGILIVAGITLGTRCRPDA
jgi:hypothetical protein